MLNVQSINNYYAYKFTAKLKLGEKQVSYDSSHILYLICQSLSEGINLVHFS